MNKLNRVSKTVVLSGMIVLQPSVSVANIEHRPMHTICSYIHSDTKTGEREVYQTKVVRNECPDIPKPDHETHSVQHTQTIENPHDCAYDVEGNRGI